MLTVYTRHLKSCEHRNDSRWRRCHCPKWIRGLLLNGEKIRRTAQTASWENAEKLARKLEADVDPEREKIEARREFTLREAVETFLGDQKARGLGKETQKKYRGFLERQFLIWADSRKIKFLVRVNPAELTKFRASWSNGETTTHRKHEMLASFFRFCQRNELIGKNPMDQVSLLLGHSSVKITERHYAPFCKARQQQLTAAVKKSWGAREPKPVASTYSESGPVVPPTMMIQ